MREDAPPESPTTTTPTRSWESWFAIGTLLLAAIAIAFLFGVFDRPKPGAVGKPFPSLSVKPFDGEGPSLTTENLTGKITLINLWGPWCPPCLQELPEMVHIAEHHANDPEVQVLLVSCAYDGRDESDEHLSQTRELLISKGIKAPIYLDTGNTKRSVAEACGDMAFPTTVLVGPNGKIAGAWVGYESYYPKEMDAMLHAMLNKTAKK